MSLTIDLPGELEQKLEAEAKRKGISTDALARIMLEEKLKPEDQNGSSTLPRVLAKDLPIKELFINCEAKVDTGAELCLFQRAIGEAMEISIENGVKKRLETLTGVLTAYGHEVVLEVLACKYKRSSILLRVAK